MDFSEVENYLFDLLPRAGKILMKFFQKERLQKERKGRLDLVTAADWASEKFIKGELKKNYPGIPVLSEETAPVDFSSFNKHRYLFIVDPLDGTLNYSRGDPHFAISVALVTKTSSLVGVVYLPIQDKLLWTDINQKNAYCNKTIIEVSKTRELDESFVCIDWPYEISQRKQTAVLADKLADSVLQVKILNSAVLEMAYLSMGKIDILHYYGVKPWDIAAAALIAEKSGAKVTDIKGKNWDIYMSGILAANPILHGKILRLIS